MGSFIDRQRANPPVHHRVSVHGFDPDEDTVGWASIHTVIPPHPEVRPIISMSLIRAVRKCRNDVEQVEEMIERLSLHRSYIDGCPYVFVEAQQVYPTPDESPRERVAKANDLLRLAQVTGAVQAIAHAQNARLVRAVLPATWKGQRQKEVTVAELCERYATNCVTVIRGDKDPLQILGAGLNDLPGGYGHALDAFGIADYGLNWLSRHQEVLRD